MVGGYSNSHLRNLPFRDRFILVGLIWANVILPDKTCQNKPVPFWQVSRRCAGAVRCPLRRLRSR
ncbi:hypothetical protein FYJ41_02270 [Collinsella sp. WCA1-178-WT-3 (M2)]|nr:hypothetical protein [Collinsella sp. WCA1-178-WT-3 (M2)]MSS51587.1 hypothetical protein [Collinsella sp. WCA1-178-WT-3 (M1)]